MEVFPYGNVFLKTSAMESVTPGEPIRIGSIQF